MSFYIFNHTSINFYSTLKGEKKKEKGFITVKWKASEYVLISAEAFWTPIYTTFNFFTIFGFTNNVILDVKEAYIN